jgi:hypothetical protein
MIGRIDEVMMKRMLMMKRMMMIMMKMMIRMMMTRTMKIGIIELYSLIH